MLVHVEDQDRYSKDGKHMYAKGSVMHSVTVSKLNSDGSVAQVTGLGGVMKTIVAQSPDESWPLPSEKRYYSRPKEEYDGFIFGTFQYPRKTHEVTSSVKE